jgi:hypothetical protein
MGSFAPAGPFGRLCPPFVSAALGRCAIIGQESSFRPTGRSQGTFASPAEKAVWMTNLGHAVRRSHGRRQVVTVRQRGAGHLRSIGHGTGTALVGELDLPAPRPAVFERVSLSRDFCSRLFFLVHAVSGAHAPFAPLVRARQSRRLYRRSPFAAADSSPPWQDDGAPAMVARRSTVQISPIGARPASQPEKSIAAPNGGYMRVSHEQDKSQKVTPGSITARQHSESPGWTGGAARRLASDHGTEVSGTRQ